VENKQTPTKRVEIREGGYRPAETPAIPTAMIGPQIVPIKPAESPATPAPRKPAVGS
jgi:hypothetical protein